MRASWLSGLGYALALAGASCAWNSADGAATGAECDPTLDYAKDVAPIVARYCSACHARSVPLEARHGAPGDHDFDSEADLIAHAQRVDARAGAGPDARNHGMPPARAPQPSDDERATLAQFLACHAAGASEPHHH